MKIYWANALFSIADRNFNDTCVKILRNHGHTVFEPQEYKFKKCNSKTIFSKDTEEVQNCDVLIACLDQDPVDSGTACELGIAWALNKKMIGLYTDCRQFYKGEGKKSRNLYVLGCIRSRGVIVKNINEVLIELENIKKGDLK